MFSEHYHFGSLRQTEDGRAFISEQGNYSDFDEVEVDPNTVGQMVEIHGSKKVEVFEGDIIEVTNSCVTEGSFKGVIHFQDGTFCLKSLEQSEGAKKHNYVDLVRFWSDGSHDHYSLEMICDGLCDVEVLGNIH